jgi:TatA/E family protein of Tat protein translocase
MWNLGMPELVVIFLVALVIFGPKKLPELGRSLGRSLSEFKRASNELKRTLEDEIRIEERRERTKDTKEEKAVATPAEPVAAQSAEAVPAQPADQGA